MRSGMKSSLDACVKPLRGLGQKLVQGIHPHELNARLRVQKVLPKPIQDGVLDPRRPRVPVLVRQAHQRAILLIEQPIIDAPRVHANTDKAVGVGLASGGNAPLDLVEQRRQVPVKTLAPPNRHIREAVRLSQSESLAVERPRDGPPALSA